jgi:hypothetical protein
MMKLDFKKPTSSLAALGVALMNFIALAFTIVKGIQETKSGTEKFFANGYTLIFSDCPTELDSIGGWLAIYSKLYFFVAIAIILGLALSFFMKKELNFGKAGTATTIISSIMAVGYMINGIAANAEVSESYSPLYFNSYTLAFIPAIIIIALASAQFYLARQEKDGF